MNKAVLITTAVAGATLLGASYVMRRSDSARLTPVSTMIPIITPVIDLGVAEAVLEAMEHIPGDEVTVLLHTQGGCVASCVMISNALRQFGRSTAVIPYMAISGGTLIALNAKRLQMGRNAALSAVDPIVSGVRAKHLPEDSKDAMVVSAREYERAITDYLTVTLAARQGPVPVALVDKALERFMGDHTPHEWPIGMSEVSELGIPVSSAPAQWSSFVDAYRKRWW